MENMPTPATTDGGFPHPKRAFLYLRVSTSRQATKNNQAEGYSIPQQREFCADKARYLGAVVVEEFVDAGASARSANRPALQQMLAALSTPGANIDYVIVHKLDRLARDRMDDVSIVMAIKSAGATLVSVSELIDETPSGKLMHAILSGFAEYYSSNLSAESKKGMAQKAKSGGTHGVAPIGYLNTLARVDGREVKGIALDPERAPHLRWAFKTYATGDWSISTLRDALEERGLRSRVTQRYRGTPLSDAQVHRFLKNPYYIGKIVYQGVILDGAHDLLIDEKTWFHCQDVLAGRRLAGDRAWKRNHPLKGSLVCNRCGGRMGYGKSRGRGGVYEYFFCLGRHTGRTDCNLPYVSVDKVEHAVLQQWRTKGQLSTDEIAETRAAAIDAIDEYLESSKTLLDQQAKRLHLLERKKQKLIDAYLDDTLPAEDIKARQLEIQREISDARDLLRSAEDDRLLLLDRLETVLAALEHAAGIYETSADETKRTLNQALFEFFRVDLVDEGGTPLNEATYDGVCQADATLTPPAEAVVNVGRQSRGARPLNDLGDDERTPASQMADRGSNVTYLAVTVGFEPTVGVNLHNISSVAPSAARTRHRREAYDRSADAANPRSCAACSGTVRRSGLRRNRAARASQPGHTATRVGDLRSPARPRPPLP